MPETSAQLRVLKEEIVSCRKCPRLVNYREKVAPQVDGVLPDVIDLLRQGGYVSEIVEFASARLHPALTLQALEPGADAAGLRRHASLHPGQLIFGDQDAMNAVLAGERLALHPRWNCMNSVLTFEDAVEVFGEQAVREARENPALRHFEGPDANKPWHAQCPDAVAQAEYLRHRRVA